MPTGYTSDLYEGKPQTFDEFALQCARNFGALICMRDSPMDAPIKPSAYTESTDYHERAIMSAEGTLAEARTWTDDEAESRAASAYLDALARHQEEVAKTAALRDRYEEMLERVRAWQAPTEDHVGLRDFMEQQLVESIRFDCSSVYPGPPARQSGAEYRTDAITRAERDIAYHKAELAKVAERNRTRVEWVTALLDSLQKEPVPA